MATGSLLSSPWREGIDFLLFVRRCSLVGHTGIARNSFEFNSRNDNGQVAVRSTVDPQPSSVKLRRES